MDELSGTKKAKFLQGKVWLFCVMALGIAISILAFSVIYDLNFNSSESVAEEVAKEDLPIYDVSSDISDPSYWVWKNEAIIKEQSAEQKKLAKKMEELKSAMESTSNQEYIQQLAEQQELINDLQHKLLLFEKKLAEQSVPNNFITESPTNNQKPPTMDYYQDYIGNNNFAANNIADEYGQNDLVDFHLELVPAPTQVAEKSLNIKNYLPANTYVAAILLSGVDVSSGISSQHQPKPVLLRITDFANFPNHMRGRLKACRVSAQSWGDLSSERAYMRPDILTCVTKDGSVIETSVQGFVVGEDGKVGVRGKMIMRDKELLVRGFMGGLFSGLGKATSESFSQFSTSPLGTTAVTKGADIFRKGAAEGVGNAFDLIAKYNIKRAEQYQPIIQVSAGRVVDIVFHTGSKFGELRPAAPAKENTTDDSLQEVFS